MRPVLIERSKGGVYRELELSGVKQHTFSERLLIHRIEFLYSVNSRWHDFCYTMPTFYYNRIICRRYSMVSLYDISHPPKPSNRITTRLFSVNIYCSLNVVTLPLFVIRKDLATLFFALSRKSKTSSEWSFLFSGELHLLRVPRHYVLYALFWSFILLLG